MSRIKKWIAFPNPSLSSCPCSPFLFFFLSLQPFHTLSNLQLQAVSKDTLAFLYALSLFYWRLSHRVATTFAFYLFLLSLFPPTLRLHLSCSLASESLSHCMAAPLQCRPQFASFLGLRYLLRLLDQILAADDCFHPTLSCLASVYLPPGFP